MNIGLGGLRSPKASMPPGAVHFWRFTFGQRRRINRGPLEVGKSSPAAPRHDQSAEPENLVAEALQRAARANEPKKSNALF
jgi:hypothetical protein